VISCLTHGVDLKEVQEMKTLKYALDNLENTTSKLFGIKNVQPYNQNDSMQKI